MTQVDNLTREYEESLYRAFIEGRADYVLVDGWSNGFLRSCTSFALNDEIIYYDSSTSRIISNSQYTALVYRLTESGKERLLKLSQEISR